MKADRCNPEGPDRNDTRRDCFLLGESIPFTADSEREELALPRERRERGGICTGKGVGGQGWEDILPATAGRHADGKGHISG